MFGVYFLPVPSVYVPDTFPVLLNIMFLTLSKHVHVAPLVAVMYAKENMDGPKGEKSDPDVKSINSVADVGYVKYVKAAYGYFSFIGVRI